MYLFSLRHHFPLPPILSFFTYTIIEWFPTTLQQLRKQRRETWSVTLASESLPLSTTRLVPWPEISLGRNFDNDVCIDDSPLLPNFLASLRFRCSRCCSLTLTRTFLSLSLITKVKKVEKERKIARPPNSIYVYLSGVARATIINSAHLSRENKKSCPVYLRSVSWIKIIEIDKKRTTQRIEQLKKNNHSDIADIG